MKRSIRSAAGVTLLEIMLVLAIAAMIIVMSVRYYQSATTSQQVNNSIQQLQAYMAAADNLAVGSGSYTSVNKDAIISVVGQANAGNPGTLKTFTGANTSYTMVVTYAPAALCNAINAQLKSIHGSRVSSNSCSGADLTFTYTPY